VYPVLCGLTNKVLLATTCRRVTLDGTTSCPHVIVDLGKLDNEVVIVVLEEWLCIESGREQRFELRFGMSLVVLLDNLLETSVVELDKFGQVVDIGDNVGQVFLEEIKVFFARRILNHLSFLGVLCCIVPGDHILDLLLAITNPADDLLALDFLKCKDLVQFLLKRLVEPGLVLIGPFPAWWIWVL